jgi:hypothetical protein
MVSQPCLPVLLQRGYQAARQYYVTMNKAYREVRSLVF